MENKSLVTVLETLSGKIQELKNAIEMRDLRIKYLEEDLDAAKQKIEELDKF